MRIVRAVAGTLLLIIALPMLIAGGVLWEVSRHRDADGAFRAALEPVHTDGTAIVVPDLDGLLRREAAFARGGRTTLQVDAPGLFVGVAPQADIERYLTGAGWLVVDRVRLARGPLPVDANTVAGASPAPSDRVAAGAAPGGVAGGAPGGPADGRVDGDGADPRPAPVDQAFWRLYTTADDRRPLTITPSAMRGEALALVIMNGDGTPGVSAEVTVAVTPRWLNQTTWGVLILGTVLLLLAALAIAWPRPSREVVYVVESAQVSDVAARLGLPLTPPRPVKPVPPPQPLAPPAALSEPPTLSAAPAAPAAQADEALPRAPVTVHLDWPPVRPARSTASPVPAPAE